MKKWLTWCLILLIAAYVAYPYVSAQRTWAAIQDGDERALSHYVDWPSIRESLKSQLVAAGAANVETDDVASMLGAGLGALFAEKLIDNLVTPSGLAKLMQSAQSQKEGEAQAPSVNYAFFTENPLTFLVVMEGKDGAEMEGIFRLNGARWQLSELWLPEIARLPQ